LKNKINQFNLIFLSTLTAILIWMVSTSAKSMPLQEYEARYAITWHGMNAGESVHKLHRNANGEYHFETRTTPHIKMLPFNYVESSDFILQDGKILPQNYYYDIKEGKRHKKGNVAFNWKSGKLSNHESQKPWESEISLGIQDKLTQTLSLRQTLKTNQPQLQFLVAEEDKIKSYSFKIIKEDRVLTKLGVFNALKVEHISRKGHRTTMWLAKTLDYIPIKMTQMRQGKIVAGGEILDFKFSRR